MKPYIYIIISLIIILLAISGYFYYKISRIEQAIINQDKEATAKFKAVDSSLSIKHTEFTKTATRLKEKKHAQQHNDRLQDAVLDSLNFNPSTLPNY